MAPAIGQGWASIKMGELERYQRNINGTLSEGEVRQRLEELKRDICSNWKQHKLHERIMHGEEIEDNGIDMVLVYLIKKGIL